MKEPFFNSELKNALFLGIAVFNVLAITIILFADSGSSISTISSYDLPVAQVGVGSVTLPSQLADQEKIPQNTFRGEYFAGKDFNPRNLKFVRTNKTINFKWYGGAPSPKIGVDNFSVRWRGNFKFNGRTVFRARADDGVRLWVGDDLVIDEWREQGVTDFRATRNLVGEKTVTVEYFEEYWDAEIKVSWLEATARSQQSLDSSYDINVLAISYFPFTKIGSLKRADGTLVDSAIDENYGLKLAYVRKSANDQIEMLKNAIERSSTYLGYSDSNARPALRYKIARKKEYLDKTPYLERPDGRFFLDYPNILKNQNICSLVEKENISEVWILIPSHRPGYEHAEFFLSGSFESLPPDWSDFSDKIPVCKRTYKVVTHNYDSGVHLEGEYFIEVWGHMVEYEMRQADAKLFSLWQGPCYGQNDYLCFPAQNESKLVVGRCGNVHNPPNARWDYDRDNITPNASDCRDWNPDGLGAISSVSCKDWGCDFTSMTDNATLNYIVWNWQNLPGRNNKKTFQGAKLRNWWDAHGDYDGVISNGEGLILPVEQ